MSDGRRFSAAIVLAVSTELLAASSTFAQTAAQFEVTHVISLPSTLTFEQQESTSQPPSKPPAHRFFDKTNLWLTTFEFGGVLTDGVTTEYGLHHTPGFYEGDPAFRWLVNHGYPGMTVACTIVVGGMVGLADWLHRSGHHRWERALPLLVGTWEIVGNFRNIELIHRLGATQARGSGR